MYTIVHSRIIGPNNRIEPIEVQRKEALDFVRSTTVHFRKNAAVLKSELNLIHFNLPKLLPLYSPVSTVQYPQ